MDKLKEYLLRHKADLDVDSPSDDTWEYIRSSGMPTGSGSLGRVVRYAAAACVIALAGTGLWLAIKDHKTPADTAEHTGGVIIKDSLAVKEKTETTVREETKTSGKDLARNTATPKKVRLKARSQKPATVSDEIDAIDKSYSGLIDYQLRKLRATPLYAENDSYFSFYIEQFKQTDQDEQEVKNDIRTYGLTGEFLGQLINVYQQKLNLLKNLQTEINKMNNKVREKQSPSAKANVYYLNI